MTVRILEQGDRNAVVLCDAGDTITCAALTSAPRNPAVPITLSIDEIWYDVGDLAVATAINISFDATVDDLAWTCTGRGHMCWEGFGGIPNPRSAGFTGSIAISGIAPAGKILLKLRKSYD